MPEGFPKAAGCCGAVLHGLGAAVAVSCARTPCIALERGRGAGRAERESRSNSLGVPRLFGNFYLPVPLEALVFGAVCEQAGNAAEMFCSLGWGVCLPRSILHQLGILEGVSCLSPSERRSS